APGTSTSAGISLGKQITGALLQNPQVRSVAQQLGRAEQGEDTAGPEFSEFHIELAPVSGDEEEKVEEEIRDTVRQFPGISFGISPFLEERIEEVVTGARGEITVSVLGDDL